MHRSQLLAFFWSYLKVNFSLRLSQLSYRKTTLLDPPTKPAHAPKGYIPFYHTMLSIYLFCFLHYLECKFHESRYFYCFPPPLYPHYLDHYLDHYYVPGTEQMLNKNLL